MYAQVQSLELLLEHVYLELYYLPPLALWYTVAGIHSVCLLHYVNASSLVVSYCCHAARHCNQSRWAEQEKTERSGERAESGAQNSLNLTTSYCTQLENCTFFRSVRYKKRWNSFSKRIVNVWNSLPERVVMSKYVGDFRHQVNNLHFCDYCGNAI